MLQADDDFNIFIALTKYVMCHVFVRSYDILMLRLSVALKAFHECFETYIIIVFRIKFDLDPVWALFGF